MLCERGHDYDPQQNARCPYCPLPNIDLGSVRQDFRQPQGAPPTVPAGAAAPPPPPRPGAHRKTVIVWPTDDKSASKPAVTLDPVVGWIVAVEGPAMGRDFRIHWGNNSIGRAPDQAISLSDDQSVHSKEHAFIIYDPKSHRFLLRSGVQKGLVYVDNLKDSGPALVLEPVALEPYNVIQIGQSKLVFVPLCGELFQWSFFDQTQKDK